MVLNILIYIKINFKQKYGDKNECLDKEEQNFILEVFDVIFQSCLRCVFKNILSCFKQNMYHSKGYFSMFNCTLVLNTSLNSSKRQCCFFLNITSHVNRTLSSQQWLPKSYPLKLFCETSYVKRTRELPKSYPQ